MFAAPTLSEAPHRLIGVSTLSRFFAAGASVAAKSLKYASLGQAILEEELGPQRIATVFRLSACKTARADCAFILLAGSISKYKSSPQHWGPEPEAQLCRALIGHDFPRVSDEATRFIKARWSEIEALSGRVATA
jgi:hypothetical protein